MVEPFSAECNEQGCILRRKFVDLVNAACAPTNIKLHAPMVTPTLLCGNALAAFYAPDDLGSLTVVVQVTPTVAAALRQISPRWDESS